MPQAVCHSYRNFFSSNNQQRK